MKKCFSVLLAVVLMLSSFSILVYAKEVDTAEIGAGTYTSIPSLKISRVVQSGDRDCHWCSMITTVGYAVGTYSYGGYSTDYRIAGKDYTSYNDAVSQKLLSHSNSHYADSDMSIFPVSMGRNSNQSNSNIGNNSYTYQIMYNQLKLGRPISVYATGNSNHASVVIGYKENSNKTLSASGFIIMEVKKITSDYGTWFTNSSSEYNSYANSPQTADYYHATSCYVTLDSWLSYGGTNKTIKTICYPTEIKNAPSAQTYEDLGTKFYANIVPTGAGGLAVTATSDSNVQLNTLNYSDYQKWYFELQDNMSYKITNVKTGKCLDIASGVMENKTNIRVYASNDTAAQKWYIVKNSNGYCLASAKDTGFVVDITGGTMTDGKNIQLYKSNNSPAQIFSIKKTVDYKDIGASFYANIICSNNGFAVSSNKDENVIIYKADFTDYQKWLFEQQTDKTYKITNIKTGKVLDVAGAKKEDKTNIRVYESNNTGAQRWYVVASGSGYSLIPKLNIESALDVAGGKYANNTNVQEYKINSSDAQWFYIQKTVNHQDIGESFYARIMSNDPAYSVAVNQDDNVILQTTANSDNQKWLFERQSDKTYKITNVENEKALDVVGGYTENYTNIQVYTSNDTNAQRWYVIANGEGYTLVPKSSITSALDTDGGQLEDGSTNVHQWTLKLHDAQRVFINQTNLVVPEYIELEDDFQLHLGDTKLVIVNVGPEVADQRVIWNSEKPEIITIDDNGNVTAVGIGTTYISATTSNGLMTRCEVTVTEPKVYAQYVELNQYAANIDVGYSVQLTATVYPEEADQWVDWYCDDAHIATVDEAGYVTALEEGEATIYAQSADGMATATCTVYVYDSEDNPVFVDEGSYYGYLNSENEVILYGYYDKETEIIIPAEINGFSVTELERYFLLYNTGYTSVTIPNTVTAIGEYALGYYFETENDEMQLKKVDDLIIVGYRDSAAELYAVENGFTFVELEEELKPLLGDANGDGNISVLDATVIQRCIAGLSVANPEAAALYGDVNGDGLSVLDATLIQRAIAGFSVPYPIGMAIA